MALVEELYEHLIVFPTFLTEIVCGAETLKVVLYQIYLFFTVFCGYFLSLLEKDFNLENSM